MQKQTQEQMAVTYDLPSSWRNLFRKFAPPALGLPHLQEAQPGRHMIYRLIYTLL